MKIAITLFCIFVVLAILAWLGLKVQPKSFPPFSETNNVVDTIPMPVGLPAPVDRFYQEVYGDDIPVIKSAVISGRAQMRINGITFPARFRFTHIAGEGYRHYIEATFFGLPIMKVNEHFLDGHGRLELPFGVFAGPQVDQAANLALWAEAIWFPSLFIADGRAQWAAVDDDTAILIVPFKEEEQQFIVRFDPESGLLRFMESMRYRDAEGGSKILWLNEASGWNELDGNLVPAVGAATWFDEGTPWAVFTVEEMVYNANVEDYIQAVGP